MAAGRNGETLPTIAFDLDAVARQQVQGDFNVGLGDELSHHFNHDVFLCRQRQGHEKCGEELAGHIAAHLNGFIELQLR